MKEHFLLPASSDASPDMQDAKLHHAETSG